MIRILRVLVPASVLILFLAEIGFVFGSYVAATYADRDVNANIFLRDESGLLRIGIVVALTIAGLYFHNLYGDIRIRSRVRLLQQLCFITGVVFLAQALIGYLNHNLALPRKIMLPGSMIALAGIFGLRLLLTTAIRNAVGSRRILFLGMTPTVTQVAGHLGQHPELGLSPIGYLDSGVATETSGDLVRLGSMDDLSHVIEEQHPDWIVVGKRGEIPPWRVDELLEMRFGGIRAEPASRLYESTFGRVSALEILPAEVVFGDSMRPDSAWVDLQTVYATVFSLVALAVTLPLMLLIAALVKITSPGPIFALQWCAGLHAAPFSLYQFRCSSQGQPTQLGRLLRRLRLDGLPQLANVLRGEMSLAGPRALRSEFAGRLSELIPFFSQRHLVRPGLTGWEQVSAHAGTKDALLLLEYDLHYVRNLSPALDLLILLSALRSAFYRR
jgi:lipopolysaccharide/colanic/teichoic acid biosynthesis glycosyltransferase